MSNHYVTIPGKGFSKGQIVDTPLNFKIAEESAVIGYGMPITTDLCRHLIRSYNLRQDEIYNKLKQIQLDNGSRELVEALSPDKEVVAGVYGKETILQILNQEGCEGLMYIKCVYQGEDSIILLGVDKNGQPIGGVDKFKKTRQDGEDMILFEVKRASKRRSEINKMIEPAANEDDKFSKFIDVLFLNK